MCLLIGAFLTGAIVWLRRQYAEFYGQLSEDYEDNFPIFELDQCLRGEMICEGLIFGPLGRVTSTFAADFTITWQDEKGVIDEHFRYDDGSTQVRQWRITKQENGRFDLQADDVPGGGWGVTSGSAAQMRYPIRLPADAGGHVLKSIDWMYLTPDGTIMNRSQFRKYGFKVAELVATIRPKEV
ncbi:MAG: DUF3833 family protein [Sulfitobacter sp.]